MQNGRFDEAVAYLESYRTETPERTADAGLLLGAVYVQKGEADAAERELA